LSYSRFINSLDTKGVVINRKVLASLAVDNPDAFSELVKFAAN
jgi:large subunit ribosomal protein L20